MPQQTLNLYYNIKYAKSGCVGNTRGKRTDVGTNLSLEKCLSICEKRGLSVCSNVEFGGKEIGFTCRLWSGQCKSVMLGSHGSMVYEIIG